MSVKYTNFSGLNTFSTLASLTDRCTKSSK
nr:MAG TPA: hypothetical protein [Caudoviricetes sp.]